MIRVACVGAAWARAALCGCSGPDGGGPGPAHHRDVVYGQRRVLCANKASCLRTKACFVRKQSMLLTNKGVFCAQTRHAAYEQRRVLCANKACCLRTKACFVRKQGTLLTNKGVFCAQTRHAAYELRRVLCVNKARRPRTKRALCVCVRALGTRSRLRRAAAPPFCVRVRDEGTADPRRSSSGPAGGTARRTMKRHGHEKQLRDGGMARRGDGGLQYPSGTAGTARRRPGITSRNALALLS